MKNKILIAIAFCAMALTSTVRAAEGGTTHYAPGMFSDFSGMPAAEPGFYLGNYFLNYGNGKFGGGKDLPLGGNLAVGVTANAQAEAPLGVFAFPWQPANFTFATAVAPSWVWDQVQASATFDRNRVQLTGAKSQSANGFGDIYFAPIMAGWTNGDFHVGGMFNMWAPTGSYNKGQLANPGLGYWTFEPMLAFSWLSTKIGTEFTIFPAVDFNTINHTTDYQSGNIFHIDGTLAQHLPLFHGFMGVGCTFSYLNQFTGDSGSGAKLGSFEMQSVAVGPTFSYVHPIGKAMLVADITWLPQVSTRNSPQGNFTWFKLMIAF
jgi:hypothetical protein